MHNQRIFMDNLAKRLNIKDPQEWYTVTHKMFWKYGGGGLIKKYNSSPRKVLQNLYPEYPNDPYLISS